MTRWKNKKPLQDAGEVSVWLQNNIIGLDGIPISVAMNNNGTVQDIDIDKALSVTDKAKIVAQFPELAGKEV